MALAAEVLRHLVTGKGMLTCSASLDCGIGQGARRIGHPGVQCSIADGSSKDGQVGAPGRPALRAVPEVDDFRHHRRGLSDAAAVARLRRDALAKPGRGAGDQPALSDPTDRRAIVGGLRFVRHLFAAPALARYCDTEILPGAAVESDDELLDYARQRGSTVYHATCTCKMGSDGVALVDD